MKCVYCDEDEKTFGAVYHEMPVATVRNRLLQLESDHGPHHAVSLTGGEPLLYGDFLKELLPRLHRDGFRLYLETNGTYPERLQDVLPWIDIIAMDIKLPSATQDRPFWEEHRAFLNLGKTRGLFVKIVVTEGTRLEEVQRAIREVASVSRDIPFVLQPVTPHGVVKKTPSQKTMFSFEQEARTLLRDVRVIPQLHKLVGVQ